jgi:chemotaxis signal transduction protein
MRELMLFQAGGYRLALGLGPVRGIHPPGDLRPAGPGRCRLEGREMDLHDLSRRLGGPESGAAQPRVIRMEVAETPLALRVDGVDRVDRVAEERIVPLPEAFAGRPARWFPAVVRTDDGLALLLSPEGMLGILPPESASASGPAAEPLPDTPAAEAAAELISADRLAACVLETLERRLIDGLRRRLRALPGRLFSPGAP